MYLTKIVLNRYLNFSEGLEIDLTYPSGHEKAGSPLQKICFIGQSCTGKTSLLNLIKYISFSKEDIDKSLIQEDLLKNGNVEIHYKLGHRSFSKKINKLDNLVFFENGIEQGGEYEKIIQGELAVQKPNLISFPFNVIEKADNEKSKPLFQPSLEQSSSELTVEQRKQLALSRSIWDFSKQDINQLWEIVSDQISFYKRNLDKEKNKLIHNLTSDSTNAKSYIDNYTTWQMQNGNPVKKLADEFLDEILGNFKLKTKTELDFDNESDLSFIRLFQHNGHGIVPHHLLSTGVKQVILTALPLYFLKPSEAIILFDQPESSLFPNIQFLLVETYVKQANNSQFFFATHSPAVASAFEPCERIILNFDDDGKVVAGKGVAPEGDDPNNLLIADFGLDTILGKKGQEAYTRFVELKTLIKAETDVDRKNKYKTEFLTLQTKYSF